MRCFNTTIIGIGLAGLSHACAEPVPETETLTYHRDIAPILASHCVDCHHSGGIAPFPLTTHAEVMPYAEAIAKATAARVMPPQNLDNSGACNTFLDARWLDEDDIATIAAWVQAGAPAGSAKHSAKDSAPEAPGSQAPDSPSGWQLDRSDLTLMMPEPYTPSALEEDEYRCFILDPGLGEDAFVTGFAARLGQPAMVHHMTLFALDSAEAEAEAAALDAAEDGAGYTCFADPGVASRWLVSSGPGDPGGLMPAGTGLPMGAGRKTVLQMHYNRVNGTFPDQTAIDLKLEPGVANEAFVESVADTRFELPPGEPVVVTTDSLTLDADFTIWGVWPHMHNLGTKLRVTATRPGSETCLARVEQYEFHWQRFAFYEQPIHVHAGDTLQFSCTYDTTSRDTPTSWGLKTADEMCIAFFYITEGLQRRDDLE